MKFYTRAIALMLLPLVSIAGDLDQIQANLQKALGAIEVEAIAETPIPGLYQVSTPGTINYMSADGRYIVTGDLYDRKTNTNLTEALKGKSRTKRLDGLGNDQMLVYKAKGEEKSVLTVFTDTSCGYCRKLHHDIPKLNKEGITVRYLLYPRMGADSKAAQTMESVWCAKDSLQAMTDAKNGKYIPVKNCTNPIAEHLKIGQEFALRGTPMLVTPKGEVVPGYLPPAALKERLGL